MRMPQGNEPLRFSKEEGMQIHLFLSLWKIRLRLKIRIGL
jgi:hypothetical protein